MSLQRPILDKTHNKENIAMTVFIQLKAKSAFQGFVSTSYIGDLVTEDDLRLTLSKVCAVYEVLSQDKNGTHIQMKYCTNSAISNGEVEFNKEDILFHREVDPKDEVLKGYEDSFTQFRMSKINLQKANAPVQNMDGRQ
jgi:hypothetical protein